MSRARYDMKQLRDRVNEVDDLGNEEEQHCLTEVAQDSHHGKSHAWEIAERIAHKQSRWVPSQGLYT